MPTFENASKYCEEMMNETDDAPYGRYRSWWYCYQAFSEAFAYPGIEDRNYLTLSLAFYLASWGMYRGSSFLLQHDYQVHRIVVDYLLDDPIPKILWRSSYNQVDFYSNPSNVDLLIDVCTKLEILYKMNDPRASVTATLATKVLMGTLGCTPAYDQYVVESIKEAGLVGSPVSGDGAFTFIRKSISKISKFYFDNAKGFQKVTMKPQGFYYPPMKIMDMVLWRMSFRKREVEKILLMKSSRSKGKTKVQKTEEEDKIISDWLQKTGYDYLKDFDGTVLVPIKKNKGYKKDQANDDLKKEYQKLYENFADNYYDSRKKIFRNNVPDEE